MQKVREGESRGVCRPNAPRARLFLGCRPKFDLLAKQTKVRVMAEQAEHDEVRIKTVQAMADVRVVVWLSPREADIFHDFVLALAGHFVARKHDLHFTPVGVLRDFLVNEVSEVR